MESNIFKENLEKSINTLANKLLSDSLVKLELISIIL